MATQFIPVHVPSELLPEVYELIAQRTRAIAGGQRAGEAPRAAASTAASGAIRKEARVWPPEELEDLYNSSNRRMRAILELLASQAEETFTTRDFARVIGKDGPRATWSVAGVLGAFGKRVNTRHGGRPWPFHVEPDQDTGEIDYSMPKVNADVIAALAGAGRT